MSLQGVKFLAVVPCTEQGIPAGCETLYMNFPAGCAIMSRSSLQGVKLYIAISYIQLHPVMGFSSTECCVFLLHTIPGTRIFENLPK